MDFKHYEKNRLAPRFNPHYQELVDYGNFNNGVLGKALGFDEYFLMSMGGEGHHYSPSGPPTFGDQIRDNFFIRMGFQYYDKHFKK